MDVVSYLSSNMVISHIEYFLQTCTTLISLFLIYYCGMPLTRLLQLIKGLYFICILCLNISITIAQTIYFNLLKFSKVILYLYQLSSSVYGNNLLFLIVLISFYIFIILLSNCISDIYC